MSIEVWLDQVLTSQHDNCGTIDYHQLLTPTTDPCPDTVTSWLRHPEDDKENTEELPPILSKQKRRLSAAMAPSPEEVDLTPRPKKKRRYHPEDLDPAEHFSPIPPLSDDAASEELESHHSGRLSPTKQLAFLEDSSDPVIYCDFATTLAQIPDDVHPLYNHVQELADGIGILAFQVFGHPPPHPQVQLLTGSFRSQTKSQA